VHFLPLCGWRGDSYPIGLQWHDRQIKVEPYRFGYQDSMRRRQLDELDPFRVGIMPKVWPLVNGDPVGQ